MSRRLILFIHSALNGVVTGDPATDKTEFGAWTRDENLRAEASEHLLRVFETADTIMLGRATYESTSP